MLLEFVDSDSQRSFHLEIYGGPKSGTSPAARRLQFSEATKSAQPTPTEKVDFQGESTSTKGWSFLGYQWDISHLVRLLVQLAANVVTLPRFRLGF
ncbi:hypothetical protein HAX54_041077 [Datura stramonium]|uniref:Uncharacterized protein n=1 Tax=Datura stramonium TaxID=4076 RepID=A0ABS8VTU2_DATST|nr:hypothetical protein [Datura stramonium]